MMPKLPRSLRITGLAVLVLGLLALLPAIAQSLGGFRSNRSGASSRLGGGGGFRQAAADDIYDYGLPGPEISWTVDPAFKADVFTFARLRYGSGGGGRGGGRWSTDVPQADWNLGFRLQQMTSLKVNFGLHFVDIMPAQLARYPFVYMVEPGGLYFTDQEAAALRKYLLNGGFMMADDFWGESEWEGFYSAMTQVFPELPRGLPQYTAGANLEGNIHLRELSIDHPIFHQVFDLKVKPQMPAKDIYVRTGLTYETNHGSDASQVHYKGIFDKKGRMMAIICHNTDLGDGWEREGESVEYFKRFSEPEAYPMMINILFYTMTH